MKFQPYIDQLNQLKQEIKEKSSELPSTGSNSGIDFDKMRALEAEAGTDFGRELRALLVCTDGWKNLYWDINLFSTADLLDKTLTAKAEEVLQNFLMINPKYRSKIETFRAIAASQGFEDAFYLITRKDRTSVIWIEEGSEIVETFDSIHDFFVSMIEYNRFELGEI
jgi:hypothetical protein